MTGWDLIVFGVLFISGLVGLIRGGTREIVTIFAFLFASLGALLILPVTGPIFRRGVDPDWAGNVLAVVVVFILFYILIRILGAWASKRLQQHEQLGTVDRIFGLGFGIVRALVLVGVFHLVFHAATPPERVPGWFRDAVTYPLSRGVAKAIQTLLPHGGRAADRLAPTVSGAVRRGAADQPQTDDMGQPPAPSENR
jgi:membrane protein required for colicin V production